MLSSFSSIFLAVILIIFIYGLRRIFGHSNGNYKTKQIPTIRGWPILGNAAQMNKLKWAVPGVSPTVYSLQSLMGLVQVFKNHPAFYIDIGPFSRHYMLTKATSVELLLKSNTMINKPESIYGYLHPWLGNWLLTSKSTVWRNHRKMLTPSFHFKILDQFQPIMFEKSEILIGKLSKHIDEDPINIDSFVSLCTMDVICETAMGYDMNAQEQTENPYIKAVQILSRLSIQRTLNPHMMIDFFFNLSENGKLYHKSKDIVQNFITKVIKDRKSEYLARKKSEQTSNTDDDDQVRSKKPKAFMDLCLLQHIQDGSLSESDIRDEVNTFMFAGQDTTSVGTVWALFLLGHYPEVQTKLVQEVFDVLGYDTDTPITVDDLKNMKYLECVIKEAQRIYPSVPIIGRNAEEDFDIDGMTIKKGSVCVAVINALHHDPDVFPDPLEFIPERFLPENCVGRHPFAFTPFSAGPRNCVGQRFAFLEEKTLLANILRNLHVVSVDARDKIPISPEMVSRPAKPIRLKLSKRLT